jgi:uncharacterized protein (DUF488 family)
MPPQGLKAARLVWTIGHSNHPLEKFLGLLEQHRIDLLVDVRSSPYSRYASQFNTDVIREPLRTRAVDYLFLGNLLGGRAGDDQFYDCEGYVRYDRLAQSPEFQQGIARLLKELSNPHPSPPAPGPSTLNSQASTLNRRLALMCGEEDPTNCHRRLLVGRVLRDRGVEVLEVAAEEDFRKTKGQLTLFTLEEPDTWKSTRSVLPRKAPPSSSAPFSGPGFDA